MEIEEKTMRRCSKRPIGRKASAESFMTEKEQEIVFDSVESWNFSSLKLFLDSFLSPNGYTDISLFDAIGENIDFFQNLKLELKKRFDAYERYIAKPNTKIEPTPITHPVTRHMMLRSNSTAVIHEKPHVVITKHSTRPQRGKSQEHFPRQQMTANTIWNSVCRFFSVVPTPDMFKKYLEPVSKENIDVELGQHYTITFNQKLQQKYKNDTVLLKVPDNVVTNVGKIGNIPIVSFRRVISAFVSLNAEDEKPAAVVSIDEQNEQNKTTVLADFDVDELSENLNPTNLEGTSKYSKLSFEEKLSLEVHSIGLDPSNVGPSDTDNEIMSNIISLQQEMQKYNDSTNIIRNKIKEKLVEDHDKMVTKAKNIQLWEAMIEKAEKEAKQKLSRHKSRDKLN